MAKPKTYKLHELRNRHIACITWTDINRGIVRGDWAEGNYEKHKHKIGPACSHPEDGVCAAPAFSDSNVMEQINGQASEEPSED